MSGAKDIVARRDSRRESQHSDKRKHSVSSRRGSERTLYRQGSLPADLFPDEGDSIPLDHVDSEKGRIFRPSVASTGSRTTMRTRTPSGKSIRSRTASRADYHSDLKVELEHRLTRNLAYASFLIVFGSSFLFGYNIGVLNLPVDFIKAFYNETYIQRNGEVLNGGEMTLLWSLTTALFLPGGMIGAFSAGYVADKMGRKGGILFSHIFAFIGGVMSTLCVVAKSPELLMAGRFFTGINCGLATQLAPMFLTEITPVNLRGAIGTCHQLFITIGIFMGSVFGIRELLGTVELWPYLLVLNVVPAFVSLVLMPFIPDSPRFLMLIKKKRIAAEKSLRFYRQTLNVMADIEEMETELHDEDKVAPGEEESYTMKKLFTTRELRLPLFIAVMLQVVQQLSGINAVFFYSTGIFKNADIQDDQIQYFVLLTNAINVIMTIVAVPVMDKAGRRPLLLYPMIVMNVILIVITVALNLQDTVNGMSYLSMVCVLLYVICFAVGLGPIPTMVGAELFRQGPRPRAMSIVGLANWFFTILVAMCFESIQKACTTYTFLIFLGLMLIFTVFVYFKVPETKNKTFEEIANQFMPGGEIEVEEVLDDVFDEQEEKLDSPMLNRNGDAVRNGSVSHDDVKFGLPDDQKSLTKSAHDVNEDV